MSIARGFVLLAGLAISGAGFADPVQIGTQRQLMVDDALVESMAGVTLQMHHPERRELVLVHDAPWEGSGTGYHTVFRDGALYRMYYKAWHLEVSEKGVTFSHDTVAAYAVSTDGVHWAKPSLGLFDYGGSTDNNIVWMGKGSHDFTPFRDPNPDCVAGEEYKAVGYGDDPHGLYAFKSPDGIHWSFLQDAPVMTGYAFDTQNLAFWDSTRGEYRAYVRDFADGVRGIRTATSKDFRTWTEAAWLEYPGAPTEALYTNQVAPYYRAPQVFIGFPTRYVERPDWTPAMDLLPHPENRRLRTKSSMRYGTAVTDGLLMTSQDGLHFRRWGEAFLRPGLRTTDNWAYGDNYIAWHVVETESDVPGAPDELSLYATESYWTDTSSALRRYTLRIDGFVSVNAPLSGGEFVTKPFVFAGGRLSLNVATSAAGTIRIEVQDANGAPIEGFALDTCPEIFGDSLDWVVPWGEGSNLAALAGQPVRLRFVMRDADLYSFQFRE